MLPMFRSAVKSMVCACFVNLLTVISLGDFGDMIS